MRLIKTLIVPFALIIMLGLAGAYDFGTKVTSADRDVGRPVYQFPVANIMYWDIGPNPRIYDDSDPVYLVRLPGITVSANDVRLTYWDNYTPGTKVKAGNKDIGMPLTAFGTTGIVYIDLYGSSAPSIYDLDDPVYWHLAGKNIGTNDIRLALQNVSPALQNVSPGTKVKNFDPDHNQPIAIPPLQIFPAVISSYIKFFDANGNGVYDEPDDVYLVRPWWRPDFTGSVTVNSVRLTQVSIP